ncbi:hypothetical protein QAD02_000633 [Eretmocerus hayati]|uniref:Uncharacterized protein n=1 Tax=Eretmocerus hayati TaxID=131215 RepID=A0ACC2NE81_9HYME|nr:hypothetical protein QAD02_000633 [Eretmocerus hayati]
MDENEVSTKKLIPRLGRRAGQSSIQEERSDDEQLESVTSASDVLNSASKRPLRAKSAKGPAPSAPPRPRKTGWGDEAKSIKRVNPASYDNGYSNNRSDSREDDIPVIPDLDEIIEDTRALDISNVPVARIHRATAAAYEELNTNLRESQLFSNLDGVDLSLLTEKLYPERLVHEPDEVWSWESLFTQVASEINSESQTKVDEKKHQ